MPRRQQVYLPGGTYYIVRRTHLERPVFSHPDDYELLKSLLPAALKRTGAQLLGYCLLPDAIHLALQIDTAPVGNFMRELTSYYSRRIHQRSGERGQFFRGPYQSTLIDQNEYLLPLIQYLHYMPVLSGVVPRPDDYGHSSYRAYLDSAPNYLVHTKPLLQLIATGDGGNTSAYRRLMAEAPPATLEALLSRGRAGAPGIVGDETFIAQLPRRGRISRSRWSLDEIVTHVARVHDVSRNRLLSRSRQHKLVVARAQIAWYATERRVASLSEVARYLDHSASALTRAVMRHQLRQPELFTLHAFAPLASLGALTDSKSADGNLGKSLAVGITSAHSAECV